MDQEFDICWDVKAGKQLKKIYKYIKKNYSENTAKKVRKAIMDKIDGLRINPERSPPEPLLSHQKENFRYIQVSSYKIIYQFAHPEVRVLYIHNLYQNPEKIVTYFK
jgi:plasmid stabilization system protein ParE